MSSGLQLKGLYPAAGPEPDFADINGYLFYALDDGTVKVAFGAPLNFRVTIGLQITNPMDATIYDPQSIMADVFNKANFTGLNQYNEQNIITPASLAADVNNYDPVDNTVPSKTFDTANLILQEVDSNNTDITGFVAPPSGVWRIIDVQNISAAGIDIRFQHNNGGSDPENRLLLRDNGNRSIRPNETASFFYDHNALRWRARNRIG